MVKIERITRWLIVIGCLVLLIVFPRDKVFSWTAFIYHIRTFVHRWVNLSPGTTSDGRSITQLVLQAVPSTFELLTVALIFVIVVGVTKGIYDGVKMQSSGRGRFVSGCLQWFAESIPDFFIIFAIEVFGFYLNRHGFKIYFVGSNQFFSGLIVPAFILSLVPMMYLARLVRMTVEDQFGQQYLVTALAKGLTPKRVVFSHILPNCLGTIAHGVAPVLGMLVSNLVMVEYLLYRPGVISGLFKAMGNSGGEPMYGPGGKPMYPYEANLCFAYVLAGAFLFIVLWLMVRGLLVTMGYRGHVNPYHSTLRDGTHGRFPWQLVVGGSMMVVVLVLGLFGSNLPIPNPEYRDLIRFTDAGMVTPPFPPSAAHWLGTDLYGRDMLSRTIRDTIPTFELVLVTVAGLLVLSFILAMLSSILRLKPIRFIIDTGNTYFTLVPGIISALYILEFPIVYYLNLGSHSKMHGIVYLCVLCLVELFRVSYQLQVLLDEEANKSYMEAAEISGNSRWTTFLLYYVAPLWRALSEQGVVGFSRILMLIATLGFFHISFSMQQSPSFIEDSRIVSIDWGSLLAENSRDVMGYHWVLFAPALFVAWTVVALNFLLTGLRIVNQSVPRRASGRRRWRYALVSFRKYPLSSGSPTQND